jgi:hypothetical protein
MVRHGTQKKRRAGFKVTRKAPKNRVVKIANSVANADIKKLYDKNKTPSANLASFGLAADVNNLKGTEDSAIPLKKHAAFVGYGQVMESSSFPDKNPRRKKISDFDSEYAALNMKKHNDDWKAMEKDIKTNHRQYTAKQMAKICVLYKESLGLGPEKK